MNKHRIILVFPGPNYNLEYSLKERCEKLSANYRGTIITSGPRHQTLIYDQFNIICFKDPLTKSFVSTVGFIFYSLYFLSKARLQQDKYELFITYDPLKTGLIGALFAPLFGARLLVEVNGDYTQDIIYADIPSRITRCLKKWAMITVERFVLKRATGIKCLYQGQVDVFKPFKPKVQEVNFADYVNCDHFENMGDTNEILFAGFPFHIKGVDILIEAFKKVAGQHTDWKLKILGHYPDMAELNKHMDNHPQIFHHLPVDISMMPNHIGHCGIFVLPSRTEAMGRVLVEAMAAGKPRIGSNVGGIPTVIQNNVDGLLFESGDSNELAQQMSRLMSDAKLRRDIGKNARIRYESDFTSERYFDQLKTFYTNVLKQ
jgi:glycosyltransferase involved in cell wall biosynthesis